MVLGEAVPELSETSLRHTLILAVADLAARPQQADSYRKTEALASLLLALHDHYPTFFATLPQQVQTGLPKEVEGRHIKMRRIALASVAAYL